MNRIYIGLILLFSSLGYGQQLSETEKKMSELVGTWKTEVEGSSLTLVISLEKENKEFFQVVLINVNGEKFTVNESTVSSSGPSAYQLKVIKASFEQYQDCKIQDAIIDLKKLGNDAISFGYHSKISDCTFGADNGLEIPDIDGLIFKKEK
ncbi:hypothetical protein PYS58_01555 [Chryseobacterium indologenes]|uniref:hypothetical protein n=1 Tax=Chryseobacterium TaxID=59732 RepID=UPI0016233F2B|nr:MULTISPECIES: hypothetical protein [Chryseobacterium]MDM1555262.1 hypothetical protein [Chryseobacterium indologenes]WET49819.1 hypothetical protein PYS58_01555 [Chryseobacterium indologenes]